MAEFTGERVIPGQVDPNLWSEHLARYAFARRFADGRRVLDAGCGTAYGTAELATRAASIWGLDISAEAIQWAREHYPLANAQFLQGSATDLPFASGSFDLVVAFEVIEHLKEYERFLAECARVLTTDGLLIVSTPNRLYYDETRAEVGPNPFHEHEFDGPEFHAALQACFPHVSTLLQNRTECFAFHPAETFWPGDVRIDGGAGGGGEAHFFLAVCGKGQLPAGRSFVYVPRAANMLREREHYVRLVDRQLAEAREERDRLLDENRKLQVELEERNQWAAQLDREIERLGEEIRKEQAGHQETVDWAHSLDRKIEEQSAELSRCVGLLDRAEATVIERTNWAKQLEAQLNAIRANRWVKAARKLGLGPKIQR